MGQHRNRHFFTACAAVFLLACCSMQVFAQTPTWGEVRIVEQSVPVRHKPDAASPLLRTLKPGDKVRVDFAQPNGWTAVFDVTESERDLTRAMGYAEVRVLMAWAQAKTAPAPTPAPAARASSAATPAALGAASAPVSQETKAAAPKEAKAEIKPAPAKETKAEVKSSPVSLAGQGTNAGKQDPVRITSDKMVYNQAENSVVFLGNVHGAQADMAIWAAKVTAYFTEKPKSKDQKATKEHGDKPAPEAATGDFGDKIDRIVAEGSVRLVSGKNEGACNLLTYFVPDAVLRMEGNPILREGQNTVRGDIIKYYMRENRSEVLSGTQRRVEAIFYSPKGEHK